jgi:hypothetical protein
MKGREEGRTSCEAERRRDVEDGTGRECRMEEEGVTTVGSGWYVARACRGMPGTVDVRKTDCISPNENHSKDGRSSCGNYGERCEEDWNAHGRHSSGAQRESDADEDADEQKERVMRRRTV